MICKSLTKNILIQITGRRFILLQSIFSVNVNGRTFSGRQMDKITGTGRDTHNTFTKFIGRYKMAYKHGHQEK